MDKYELVFWRLYFVYNFIKGNLPKLIWMVEPLGTSSTSLIERINTCLFAIKSLKYIRIHIQVKRILYTRIY